MAQKTAWNAAALTEADINLYLMGEGGAWTSWTPTVTQSGSVTVTNTRSRFARYGRTIIATFNLSVTGTGTASNSVSVSLPVTAAASGIASGTGALTDASASITYLAVTWIGSTTAINLFGTSTDGAGVALGSAIFTAALASGDTLQATLVYEAAS